MTDKPQTVQDAWADVMVAARALGKGNTANAGGTRFNFRGVDDVMNLVGPILRDSRVSVLPSTAQVVADREVTTKAGSIMRNVTVAVSYTVHGPDGSTMPGAALGEASDSGDKAVSKAMSVAFRTFLLQSLCLPTDEPDPDLTIHDRGERGGAAAQPQAVRGRAQKVEPADLDAVTSFDALEALWARAEAAGQGKDEEVKGAFAARAEQIEAASRKAGQS